MTGEPINVRDILKRIEAGAHTVQNLAALRRTLERGQDTMAAGDRSVAIGGSVIITGDQNKGER